MKYLIVWFFIAMCISDIKAQEKEFIRDNFPGMGSRFNKALHAYLLGNSLFNEGGKFLLSGKNSISGSIFL